MGHFYAAPVYFLGPILLMLLAWRLAGARQSAFWIGLPAFLLSQLLMAILIALFGVLGALVSKQASAQAVIVGGWLAAGLCEESCRMLALRWLHRRKPTTDRTGLMYAIGHSGMETIIVGAGTLALVMIPAEYLVDALGEETLSSAASIPTASALIYAAHRLLFGLLIHATYTALVLRFIHRGAPLWLLAAMALHAANNAVSTQLQERLSDLTFLGGFSVVWLLLYGGILLALYRKAPLSAARP